MAIAEHFPAYPPYAGAHAEVIPHLTVAQSPTLPSTTSQRSSAISRSIAREAWLMVEGGDRRWTTRAVRPRRQRP